MITRVIVRGECRVKIREKLTRQQKQRKSSEDALRTSLIAQLVKNPPAMRESLVPFLSQEDPLAKG